MRRFRWCYSKLGGCGRKRVVFHGWRDGKRFVCLNCNKVFEDDPEKLITEGRG